MDMYYKLKIMQTNSRRSKMDHPYIQRSEKSKLSIRFPKIKHFSILIHINLVQILTLNRHIRTQKIKVVNPGKQIHMYTVSNS